MLAMPQHVDTLGSLVRFGRRLREAGLAVNVGQLACLARAFQWLDPLSRSQLYHAARTTLVTRREDMPVFDRIFESFWSGAQVSGRGPGKLPLAPRHVRQSERPALATLLAQKAQAGDPELEIRDRSHTAQHEEVLGQKDFALMSALELEAVRRVLAVQRWDFATRLTRRKQRQKSGPELDLRRVPARAARAGGVLLDLPRRRPKIKQRRLVVLADVSGSMELYARVLLHFFHALRQQLDNVESFVFATRLTRITPQLRLQNIDRALEEVSASVLDFASGTRIGESLHTFNGAWARRLLGRGAVVIIVSDGWERGSATVLKQEMRILRQHCYRVIWLNPRLGQASYEPRVEGMAAALHHVDDFLSCHNLQSLAVLARHLRALPRRRGSGFAGNSLPSTIAGPLGAPA
jgi:uncharacterized protein with von Willebrand factor type A (vWA) domain